MSRIPGCLLGSHGFVFDIAFDIRAPGIPLARLPPSNYLVRFTFGFVKICSPTCSASPKWRQDCGRTSTYRHVTPPLHLFYLLACIPRIGTQTVELYNLAARETRGSRALSHASLMPHSFSRSTDFELVARSLSSVFKKENGKPRRGPLLSQTVTRQSLSPSTQTVGGEQIHFASDHDTRYRQRGGSGRLPSRVAHVIAYNSPSYNYLSATPSTISTCEPPETIQFHVRYEAWDSDTSEE